MQTVAVRDCQVVATGGGIVLDARNVLAMQQSGKVVWLTASQKTIAERMLTDDTTAGNRPSLTGQGLIGEITAVLSERIPFYEKASDFAIDTDRETVAAICDRIVHELTIHPKFEARGQRCRRPHSGLIGDETVNQHLNAQRNCEKNEH